ncbi:MAG: TlyA family RNA methyltransferase [bacterium]|nr:TlyA family RNA methyltransferase [bacterium]
MKKRLDILLLEKKLVKTRTEATALIMSNKVKVEDEIINKAGSQINLDANITVDIIENKFVSRGGLKLLRGIKEFKIDLKRKVCLDVGASTGGFTDCMLQHGAIKVYSLDVGYGQLDWSLRNDLRVMNLERINFRYYDGKDIEEDIDFVSIDVSFISLTKIIPNLNQLFKNRKYEVLALIKPQFEVGREKVGKKGVVRNEEYRKETVDKISKFVENIGYTVFGICESSIKGPAGNVEYLIYFKN